MTARAPLLAVAAALLVVAPSFPAGGSDHRAPVSRLHVEGRTQRGRAYFIDWTSRSGRYCSTLIGEGPRRFPSPVSAGPGPVRARVRFAKRQRPDAVDLRAWRVAEPGGDALGPAVPVEHRLVARRRGGQVVAWDAVFEAIVMGDYYLEAAAEWRDRNRCGGRQQVVWTYHMRFP